MNNKQQPDSNKQFILRYISLGSQLLISIGLAVFLGIKGDEWLHTSPLLVCALPLLVLVGIFIRLFRETSRRKNNE